MPGPRFPWVRLAHGNTPIYFSKEGPNWFVPNPIADDILCKLAAGAPLDGNLPATRLLSRLPEVRKLDYPGRSGLLSLGGIGELWFHLTNRCNMACGHCLFSSSPIEKKECLGKAYLLHPLKGRRV